MMIEINLLPEGLKEKANPERKMPRLEFKYIIFGAAGLFALLLVTHFYLGIAGLCRLRGVRRLEEKLQGLGPQRKAWEAFNKEYAYLEQEASQLTKERTAWAEKLNKLSLYLPSGIWFREISAGSKDFTLQGSVASLQQEQMALIKGYIDSLKADASFFSDFNSLELSSVQRRVIGGYDVDDFTLTAELKKKK
jgi:Tfp pilus assembly protein PilN